MSVESVITENLDIWTSAIKTKSASGRGSSNKLELYGIKKLRELILELAIRGKLVPQDPTDEPASDMLKRVEEERARLIKEKKIKKQKHRTVDETPFALPQGWAWARLPEVSFYKPGKTPATKQAVFWDEGVTGLPWVSISDMNDQGAVEDTSRKVSIKAKNEVFKSDLVPAGTLLMSFKLTVGKVSLLDVDAFHNEAIISIFPFSGISQKYLMNVLPKQSNAGNKKQAIKGNTLNSESLADILIPVPPEKEQERITSKLDELMTLCDQLESQTESSIEAHKTLVETLLATLTNAKDADELNESWQRISEHFDTLFTTEDSIDQLKQTILQLAVMGKLVKQDPNDEPASVLLERIAEEKEQLIKDKKIKKQKALPSLSEEEKRFNIPESWQWTRFGIVALSRLGKMLDKAKNKGDLLPYLRNTNVQWRRFELDDLKLMRFEDSELYEFKLKKGDLLICEGGEPGRCAIWNEELNEMYFQKALHRARPFADVLPEYLEVCLTVDCGNGVLEEYFTGATIKHLVGAKLNSYIIPLPPAKEQKRIVDQVNRLTAICDGLKLQLVKSQETQQYLADSISSSLVN